MVGNGMDEENYKLQLVKDMPQLKQLLVKAAVPASFGCDSFHNMCSRAVKPGMTTQQFHYAKTIDRGLVEEKEGVQLKDKPVFHSHVLASCGCPCGSKVGLHPTSVNFLPESEEAAMKVTPSASKVLAARILCCLLGRITRLRLSGIMHPQTGRCRGHVEGSTRMADKAVQTPGQTTEYYSSAFSDLEDSDASTQAISSLSEDEKTPVRLTKKRLCRHHLNYTQAFVGQPSTLQGHN